MFMYSSYYHCNYLLGKYTGEATKGSKLQEMGWRLGWEPAGGAYSAPPDPLAGLWSSTPPPPPHPCSQLPKSASEVSNPLVDIDNIDIDEYRSLKAIWFLCPMCKERIPCVRGGVSACCVEGRSFSALLCKGQCVQHILK